MSGAAKAKAMWNMKSTVIILKVNSIKLRHVVEVKKSTDDNSEIDWYNLRLHSSLVLLRQCFRECSRCSHMIPKWRIVFVLCSFLEDVSMKNKLWLRHIGVLLKWTIKYSYIHHYWKNLFWISQQNFFEDLCQEWRRVKLWE